MGCGSSNGLDIKDQLHKICAQQVNIKPHHFILEIGFRNALGLQEALNMIRGGSGRLIGTETSQVCMTKASKQFQADLMTGVLELEMTTTNTLTFIHNMFDRVFTVNGFYYWDDVDAVIQEIYRVTRPKCLFLTCVYKNNKLSKKELSEMKNTNMSTEKYADMLKENGFVKVKIQEHRNAVSGYKYQTVHAYTRSRK